MVSVWRSMTSQSPPNRAARARSGRARAKRCPAEATSAWRSSARYVWSTAANCAASISSRSSASKSPRNCPARRSLSAVSSARPGRPGSWAKRTHARRRALSRLIAAISPSVTEEETRSRSRMAVTLRLLHSRSDERLLQRQLANPLSRGGEHRVGQRRRCGRRGRLTHPTRRFEVAHQVDLDRWCLVHAQHPVVVEVGLLHSAVFEGDLPPQGTTDAEDDAAFDLCRDRVRVDDRTT